MLKYPFFIFTILFSTSLVYAQEIGSIRSLSGDVTLMRASESLTPKEEDSIQVGDTFELAKGAAAVLSFRNGNSIRLKSKTRFKIRNYPSTKTNKSPSVFELIYGTVRALVKEQKKGARFDIATPSTVTGVRGTDFLVSYDSTRKEASCTTFEGRVEFSNLKPDGKPGRTIQLAAGETSSVVKRAAPTRAKRLPKKELRSLRKSMSFGANKKPREPQKNKGPARKEWKERQVRPRPEDRKRPHNLMPGGPRGRDAISNRPGPPRGERRRKKPPSP